MIVLNTIYIFKSIYMIRSITQAIFTCSQPRRVVAYSLESARQPGLFTPQWLNTNRVNRIPATCILHITLPPSTHYIYKNSLGCVILFDKLICNAMVMEYEKRRQIMLTARLIDFD